MMFAPPVNTKVYLAVGNTDMRKAINGLSILVEDRLELDPFSGHLFVFCNRRRTIVKILYWCGNGFCLWQKRLEKHYFRWPVSEHDVMTIGYRELMWLLDGLRLPVKGTHDRLTYTTVCRSR
jgi:transposase